MCAPRPALQPDCVLRVRRVDVHLGGGWDLGSLPALAAQGATRSSTCITSRRVCHGEYLHGDVALLYMDICGGRYFQYRIDDQIVGCGLARLLGQALALACARQCGDVALVDRLLLLSAGSFISLACSPRLLHGCGGHWLVIVCNHRDPFWGLSAGVLADLKIA